MAPTCSGKEDHVRQTLKVVGRLGYVRACGIELRMCARAYACIRSSFALVSILILQQQVAENRILISCRGARGTRAVDQAQKLRRPAPSPDNKSRSVYRN